MRALCLRAGAVLALAALLAACQHGETTWRTGGAVEVTAGARYFAAPPLGAVAPEPGPGTD